MGATQYRYRRRLHGSAQTSAIVSTLFDHYKLNGQRTSSQDFDMAHESSEDT